jgi:hypothetical protein
MRSSPPLRACLVIASAAVLSSALAADTATTVLSSALPADTATTSAAPAKAPGRVVIRGSGSNVRLEREATPPVARRQFAPSRNPLLDEITKMSRSGVADPVLVTYLKTHAREVPKILNQEDLAFLQRGGVSDSVVSYLARTSAVDIGLTGEGRPAPEYAAGGGPNGYGPAGLYTDDYGNEYPSNYPTYGASYLPGRRFFRTMNRPQHPIVHPRPGFRPTPMGAPTSGAISRAPHRPDGF